jgi:flagellar basal-body rod protein FlgF
MDKLVFTSLSGAKTGTIQRTMLTNDLANISTVGFKRASFQRAIPAQLDGPGFPVRFQPLVENRTDIVNLSPGTRMDTGNPLDVAFNGQTVLGVLGEQGEIAFTRRGDLRISELGFIETSNGHLVASEGGGPLTVPEGGSVNITPDGTVFFNATLAEAAGAAPPVLVGQLVLRDASATTLQRRLDGLFEEIGANGLGGDIAPGPEVASLSSGALEGSNVNPVEVLVSLMDYYRSFETQMKIIKSAEELDQNGSRLIQTS